MEQVHAGIDRRSFVRGALAAGAAGVAAQSALPRVAGAADKSQKPNILVFIIDELREPAWFGDQAKLDVMLPNLARLRKDSVHFANHFTASNMCTPSRGALVTGLYPHQTNCLLTDWSTLNTGFPTWGDHLRQHGYQTSWWGKWHLAKFGCDMERYGFENGVCPSPDGVKSPIEGMNADPRIVDNFVSWYDSKAGDGPFCTTVSLLNPHDITGFPRLTRIDKRTRNPRRVITELPPNWETMRERKAKGKPRLQNAQAKFNELWQGRMALEGARASTDFLEYMNLYLLLQQYVDKQIGRVLDKLESRPEIAANTIIILTSDHGDHCGSHGLRTKGGSAYDEALRIPLYVKDPRGLLTSKTEVTRTQLTSSVDIVGLLLTIASGSQDWRTDSTTSYLGKRADLAALCRDPGAAGRPWIAHVTDEFMYGLFEGSPPRHITAVRTADAKLATYSYWKPGTKTIRGAGQEAELYDYSTERGRLELDSVVGKSPIEDGMRKLLDRVIVDEVREPLPARFKKAQDEGLRDYFRWSVALPN